MNSSKKSLQNLLTLLTLIFFASIGIELSRDLFTLLTLFEKLPFYDPSLVGTKISYSPCSPSSQFHSVALIYIETFSLFSPYLKIYLFLILTIDILRVLLTLLTLFENFPSYESPFAETEINYSLFSSKIEKSLHLKKVFKIFSPCSP